jgi:RNA polymerase sigma-70 factor, ECF subfamily
VKDLFEQYVPRVFRFALRLTGDRNDAEDLAQATLLRAWRDRKRLRDPAAARSWLFTIAANLWRDGLRQKDRAKRIIEGQDSSARGREMFPGEKIEIAENLRRIQEVMDSLPDRQREVLYLHACESCPLPEIAAILSISPEAVKASLSLARKQIRRQLSDLDPGVLHP